MYNYNHKQVQLRDLQFCYCYAWESTYIHCRYRGPFHHYTVLLAELYPIGTRILDGYMYGVHTLYTVLHYMNARAL